MMMLIIAIHVVACMLLVLIVLIQQGRGGGLVEGFSGVESMFGPKTSVFLTRATTVLSILFFTTCLSLAMISAQRSRSLMKGAVPDKAPAQAALPGTPQPGATGTTPQEAAPQAPQGAQPAAALPQEQPPAQPAPQ